MNAVGRKIEIPKLTVTVNGPGLAFFRENENIVNQQGVVKVQRWRSGKKTQVDQDVDLQPLKDHYLMFTPVAPALFTTQFDNRASGTVKGFNGVGNAATGIGSHVVKRVEGAIDATGLVGALNPEYQFIFDNLLLDRNFNQKFPPMFVHSWSFLYGQLDNPKGEVNDPDVNTNQIYDKMEVDIAFDFMAPVINNGAGRERLTVEFNFFGQKRRWEFGANNPIAIAPIRMSIPNKDIKGPQGGMFLQDSSQLEGGFGVTVTAETVVPEPSTWAMAVSAIVGLSVVGWRSRLRQRQPILGLETSDCLEGRSSLEFNDDSPAHCGW